MRLEVTVMTFDESEVGRLLEAVEFSAVKHRTQRRKGVEESAYVTHPIQVAKTLWHEGGVRDLDIIIAGLLHDTIEDTGTTGAEIESGFGKRVRGFVEEVTDNKEDPKAKRKQDQIDHAHEKSLGAAQIKLADKINNIRDITKNPPANWDELRKSAYIDWAGSVVAGLPKANNALEDVFDAVVREAREHLSKTEDTSQSMEANS